MRGNAATEQVNEINKPCTTVATSKLVHKFRGCWQLEEPPVPGVSRGKSVENISSVQVAVDSRKRPYEDPELEIAYQQTDKVLESSEK